MTAKTSQYLADVLRAAGFEALAVRAETDEFHDYLSSHALPETRLDQELVALMKDAKTKRERIAATAIRGRHHQGEFDASKEESDKWAESADGQAAFDMLLKGIKR